MRREAGALSKLTVFSLLSLFSFWLLERNVLNWTQQWTKGCNPDPSPWPQIFHEKEFPTQSDRPRHQESPLRILITTFPSWLTCPTALDADVHSFTHKYGIRDPRGQGSALPLQSRFFLFAQCSSAIPQAGRAGSGQLASHKPLPGLGGEEFCFHGGKIPSTIKFSVLKLFGSEQFRFVLGCSFAQLLSQSNSTI